MNKAHSTATAYLDIKPRWSFIEIEGHDNRTAVIRVDQITSVVDNASDQGCTVTYGRSNIPALFPSPLKAVEVCKLINAAVRGAS